MPQNTETQEQIAAPAKKTLSFYFPSGSADITLQQLREFFSTERDVCARAGKVADVLNANKGQLQKSGFNDIDKVIELYNDLSLDIFSISSGFFMKYLGNDNKAGGESSDKKSEEENNAKEASEEDWIRAIHGVISSEAYQKRLNLLKAATLNNPDWNKKLFEILKNKMLFRMPELKEPESKELGEAKKIKKSKENEVKEDVEARDILKQHFITPVQRVGRLEMLFREIKHKYINRINADKKNPQEISEETHKKQEEARKKQEETIVSLGVLEQLFKGRTQHFNDSMGSLTINENLDEENKRQAQQIPAAIVKAIAEPGNSVVDGPLSRLLGQNSKDDLLSLPIILNELKKIQDPIQRLKELESACRKIKTSTPTGETGHLFRRDYNNAQKKQISLLKAAYLEVVASTPLVAGSEFERYLEANYPQNGRAMDGGLLAINLTSISWFVKTTGKTTSMKRLETLKSGIGRRNPDPERTHERALTSQIAGYGRVISVGF